MRKVFGLIEFAETVICAGDSMGQTVSISLAQHAGSLTIPSLPKWDKNERNPLKKTLLGPPPARTWKRGEDLISWGRPTSYPCGTSAVERVLLEFSLESEEANANIQNIYAAFPSWLRLFEQYVTLLTTQNTNKGISGGDGPGRLEVLFEENSGLTHIPCSAPVGISLTIEGPDRLLHLDQLREATSIASSGLRPRLEYQILLEAYRARRNADYRKAIIEGATALEMCLTTRILEEFKTKDISFGKELLNKFRMLGGRFELIKLLGINLPEKDYEKLISTPRNEVVHRGVFPDEALANQVIAEVRELLQLFLPKLHEDT
ncbi:MAG: hypothetical protein Q8N36_06625 [bacterium]|nr:hypothetical protein [bacterium]